MTRIIVASKEGLDVLQDGQLDKVVLNQPTIIQIGISQKDIASMEKQGGRLVIHLKNGETIVLENFFNEATNTTEHSLVFPTEQGKFVEAQFDAQGKVIDYKGLNHVTDLRYASTSSTAATMAVDSDPSFSMGNVLKAGLAVLAVEGLYLWAFKKDDKEDSSSAPDLIAPSAPTATLADDTVTVTGKTEANAKIYLKDAAGNTVASGVADASGNYTIKLDKPLVNGDKLNVIAQDAAGNSSKATVVTGTKDTIPPDTPQAQLSDDGSLLTGKAEANAKITVYDATGKVLGSVFANKDGIYSLKLTPPLTGEAGGKVIAEDAAGNKSEEVKIIAGKDTVPPASPFVEVNKEGSVIHGKTEANAKVQIKDADGKVIGSGTADAQGDFQITLSPALTESQKGAVVVEDAAGNMSKPVEIKPGFDSIAPDKPTAQINADGTSVTGTAEANAKIEIKDATGKVIGTGTADANGKFTITISPALTDNNHGAVSAIDGAGNRSESLDIVGTKDTIPPTKPILNSVEDDVGDIKGAIAAGSETDDARPKLTGSGEANATLTIYDNGVAIGVVTVTAGRSWSFTFDKDLTLGKHSITLTQTDAAGLTSEASSPFTFYVVAPKVASLADASVSTLSTEAPSLADSVGLHTLKVAQTTTTEPTSQQKTVPVDDLLKSSSLHASDPVSKLLSSTALKTAQTPEQNDVNTSIDQTTNLDHLLPNTTSSPLQNILEQTYPVV
ncbi:BapA prefix-like domain-containing protein [Acinetobacter nosocomialis]|uniref:Ig-like repeat protein Blp2 n=1 Tax=Acinetobacter nosocomialis TaxID=106654 RepID=UPI000F0A79F8|nr:Ig-like repeat protein Blp2 [Acinetobacter nosocomialis]EKU6034105.1 BapA prefix-like domain-containing protein [Acinetobacter nosocomialis]MBJ9960254.1 BapA prefix-like domain-containing protein [Acinetobacter nosocomialis]MBP1476268.1 BapA prefix-like domain-containing protein [Acinetobacter nosocomialis]MBP1512062.1 BapA prefix-like domain-containing protein [Acinetobacter nosocomialis]HEM7452498.1 BapA prefix-like domain-containing protein [Acinetobacter nosocomialis]